MVSNPPEATSESDKQAICQEGIESNDDSLKTQCKPSEQFSQVVKRRYYLDKFILNGELSIRSQTKQPLK